MLVTTIVRGNEVVIPTGTATIEPGDLVVIAAARQPDIIQQVTAWARGELHGED